MQYKGQISHATYLFKNLNRFRERISPQWRPYIFTSLPRAALCDRSSPRKRKHQPEVRWSRHLKSYISLLNGWTVSTVNCSLWEVSFPCRRVDHRRRSVDALGTLLRGQADFLESETFFFSVGLTGYIVRQIGVTIVGLYIEAWNFQHVWTMCLGKFIAMGPIEIMSMWALAAILQNGCQKNTAVA